MKKKITLLIIIATMFTSTACESRFGLDFSSKNSIDKSSPIEATAPIESAKPTDKVEPPKKIEDAKTSAEPTQDPRDEETVVRAEIKKMIEDAEELIAEDCIDDAKIVLRDLKTRDLNDEELALIEDLEEKLK